MNVQILQEQQSIKIPSKFFKWLKTDLKCPECGSKGLIIKYRLNGEIGYSHNSSGIILACENWGKCKSWWNPIENGRDFPWHTWLSSFHKILDIQRGNHGFMFLDNLKEFYPDIYKRLLEIDKKIEENTRK